MYQQQIKDRYLAMPYMLNNIEVFSLLLDRIFGYARAKNFSAIRVFNIVTRYFFDCSAFSIVCIELSRFKLSLELN